MQSLHDWAVRELQADGCQIWAIDDLGFHPRALAGREINDGDRQLVRQCCIEHRAVADGGRVVLPLELDDRRGGACLFSLPDADAADVLERCRAALQPRLAELDKQLQLQRLAGLSGSARDSDQLRSMLTLAHSLEQCADKREVLRQVHELLLGLTGAQNFFVVVLDPAKQLLEFEYFADQYDQDESPIPFREGGLDGSLAAYVVGARRTVRGSSQDLLSQAGHGDRLDDAHYGPRAHDWLGVPMNVVNEVFGAMVIQSYEPEFRFDDRAPSVLAMLAEATGAALHRRRIREQLERTVRERTAQLEQAKQAAEQALVELREAQRHLVESEKMASLGLLVAGVAHEANTPLGIAVTANSHLQAQLEQLKRAVAEGRIDAASLRGTLEIAEQSAQMIGNNLDRAARLVQNFKQVSVDRSSDGRRHFVLAHFLDELIGSMASLWRERPLQVSVECDPELKLDSFPGALGQALSNLIQNALVHAFAEDDPGELRIVGRAPNAEAIQIDVRDNGSGIEPRHLDKIFDPFYTTRRHRGGTGLGLHIAYNLVTHKLGGSIRVNSTPGLGSHFCLRIPLSAPAVPSAVAPGK